MRNLILTFILFGFLSFLFISCSDNSNLNLQNAIDNPAAIWTVPGDFATINDAIISSNVHDGDIIKVGPGSFAGAFVTKSLSFEGVGNAVIYTGPLHSSGTMYMGFRLLTGSGNSSFSHLVFTTDLPIMNGDAVNGVKISHCEFINSTQAISNWRGNNWVIEHNTITDLKCKNGGGIGILIADFANGTVQGNKVAHNTISGTLHVHQSDLGGYSGTGIVIYADFRYGRTGSSAMKNNFITHNTISLTSDKPAVVDVIAFELTDTRDTPPSNVLFNNSIGFNDFRGTVNQIAISHAALDNPTNDISKNLGENRGHGLHPNDFKP
jgi:hypothetical protein